MSYQKFKEVTGIHITTRHTGKMSGMQSLSTSAAKNKYCAARCKNADMICNKCYAAALMDRYKDTGRCMADNTDILTDKIFPVEVWPVLNVRIFRLESFGDLNNEIQFVNYCNFARRNPKTTFALWTKNPGIIARALNDGTKKPANMIIIYSSPLLNHPVNMDKYRQQYPFIDKFFTVYDPEYIKANKVNINCGARSCVDCGRCYSKRTGRVISEKLK